MSEPAVAKFHLTCSACDWQGPDADTNTCPVCGGILTVAYPNAGITPHTDLPGLWRYLDHLPLRDPAHVVSLGEGDTPLLRAGRTAEELGLDALHYKLEGCNPTGSYKDRIAAVGMARLLELGKRAWAATSSGNAGASLAAYGVRAGVEGHLFTLEKASRAKIAQIMAYGPQIRAVERLGYDPDVEVTTWANIRRVCAANGWQMLVTAHAFSPHAMDGVKTLAYEMGEQLHGQAPDVVYVPVGGGGLCAAVWRGLVEWCAAGYLDRLPQIVAVQPAGCAAVYEAWLAGASQAATLPDCESAISGLQLTAPPDGDLALQAVRASGGWVTAVPDAQTYAAQARLANRDGVFVEPAAAITLAAVEADRAAGRLAAGGSAVCVLTGVGFKDAEALQRMAADAPLPMVQAGEILELAGA